MKIVSTACRRECKRMKASDIEQIDRDILEMVGIFLEGPERSGTMILKDLCNACIESETEGLELLSIADALEKYDWVREKYYWKAVTEVQDEIASYYAEQQEPEGYFIRVRKGAKVTLPCQAALYIASDNIVQIVHNVVILEENAELELITACVTQHNINTGMHLSVDEQYIGKNARLVSTMVHGWEPEVRVYPHSGTIVEEGGSYESNYISLRPPRNMSSNPQTYLVGKEASAKFFTVILGSDASTINIGGDVYLDAEDSTAELVHRGVCTGGKMYQKGLLIGNAPCKAHVDCAGMLLNDEGFIESVPGIKAQHPEAKMSHEASIGKIAPEQVEYLQSRGLDEKEAISLLIRGFVGTDIKGLGEELDVRIAEIAELAGHGEG